MVQLVYYQQKLKQGYDTGVRVRPLVPGDLVLRKVVGTAKNPSWGKLGSNWEGPYRITSIVGIGALLLMKDSFSLFCFYYCVFYSYSSKC